MTKDKNNGLNILKKIINTIRVESRELTDAVMDSTGTNRLEQKFDEARFKLEEAKHALTKMMQKEQKSLHLLEITKDKILMQEQLLAKALSDDNHSTVLKCAQKVADLECSLDLQSESYQSITKNTEFLQIQLEISERELKDFARQLAMLKTTENIQKATETIMNNIDNADNNLLSAKKSLNRIRERQKQKNTIYTGKEPLLENNTTENIQLKHKDNKTTGNRVNDIIRRIQDKCN